VALAGRRSTGDEMAKRLNGNYEDRELLLEFMGGDLGPTIVGLADRQFKKMRGMSQEEASSHVKNAIKAAVIVFGVSLTKVLGDGQLRAN